MESGKWSGEIFGSVLLAHAKQTYNGRPMKYPDTHFGHLSLYALWQEPFDGALSTCWGFEVNKAIAWNRKECVIRICCGCSRTQSKTIEYLYIYWLFYLEWLLLKWCFRIWKGWKTKCLVNIRGTSRGKPHKAFSKSKFN